jgi:serine/threonine-protein kinase RsbT
MGLPSALIRRVAIAAYEAEMNTVMYARRGTMTLRVTPEDVTIHVRDEGPGIPDIALAMQEGYSTATPEMREMGFGAGMGLPNIRRNTDAFVITSEMNCGTALVMTVHVS